MKRTMQNLIATSLTPLALFAAGTAHAYSNDASFDRAVQSYAASQQHQWHNALYPQASGDYVAGVQHESADAAFNRLAQGYRRDDSKWINALLPQASGDYVAAAQDESADAKFIRQITYYTRGMLDRGGWVNVYAPDSHYAVPHALLSVAVGDGVTSRAV